MDSTKIAAHGTAESVFRDMPGTKVVTGRGHRFTVYTGTPPHQCMATLWIDGIRRIDYEDTADLWTGDIAVVEVYPNAGTVPQRFLAPGGNRCGAVVVWTKRMLK